MKGNYKSEIADAVLGVYPWFSADALPNESYYDTQQAEIDQCLFCTKSQCTNCLEHNKTARAIDTFEAMLAAKKTMKEICASLKISRSTYFNYKQRIATA